MDARKPKHRTLDVILRFRRVAVFAKHPSPLLVARLQQ
jgi:hypothetical protein